MVTALIWIFYPLGVAARKGQRPMVRQEPLHHRLQERQDWDERRARLVSEEVLDKAFHNS